MLDAQDTNGDTALNIAERLGNRVLVKQLGKIGANAEPANSFGLPPLDFEITTTLDIVLGRPEITDATTGLSTV